MKKKVIIGVCVVLIIIGIAATQGEEENTNKEQKETIKTEETAKTVEKEEKKKKEKFSTFISAGQYTAGIDFPAGNYNIVVKKGSGNVNSSNMYDGGLNEVMGLEDDGMSIKEFSNAKFTDGVTVTVSSDLEIEISTKEADISNMKTRENTTAEKISLKSGNYIAGKDFKAGTYDIVALKGNGNVSSSNMYEGGLNEIMGVSKDGYSIKKYKNAALEDGVELSISGVDVKLVPSK